MIKNDSFKSLDYKSESNKSKENKYDDENKNSIEKEEEVKSDIDIINPLDEEGEVEEDISYDEIPPDEIESDKEVNENEKSKYQKQLIINFEKNDEIITVTKLSDEKIVVMLSNRKEIRIYSLKTGKLCFTTQEEEKIYCVEELRDNRIAILFTKGNELKIYSLEDKKLIIKTNIGYIGHFVELKNKDLMIHSITKIFFYKLKIDHDYELYQTINESNQEINKTKERTKFFFKFNKRNKDKYCINNVYEISNGNIVSCNKYGIKIYKKDMNGQYQLSIFHPIEEEAHNLLEINNNICIVYGKIYTSPSPTFFSESYALYKIDIENQKMTQICKDQYSTKGGLKGIILGFEYLYHKNFLFIGLCRTLVVLDLNKNGEIIGEYFSDKDKDIPTNIHQFLFNSDDDEFLILAHNRRYKLLRYKNNKFEFVEYFPFQIKKGFLILNNYKFIKFSKNKIILYQKLINH